MTEYITQELAAELSRECGLDWHRGFVVDDTSNRYADLCNAAIQHYIDQENARYCAAQGESIRNGLEMILANPAKYGFETD